MKTYYLILLAFYNNENERKSPEGALMTIGGDLAKPGTGVRGRGWWYKQDPPGPGGERGLGLGLPGGGLGRGQGPGPGRGRWPGQPGQARGTEKGAGPGPLMSISGPLHIM